MKKVFAFFIIITMLLSCFTGCKAFYGPNNLYRESLSDEVKTKIRYRILMDCDDLIDWDGANPYYGTINDCIIVQTLPHNQMFIPEQYGDIEVAGYHFRRSSPFCLYAYRDDEVCELKEAYEKGWLTKEHIEEIHKRHNEIYAEWIETFEKLYGEQ